MPPGPKFCNGYRFPSAEKQIISRYINSFFLQSSCRHPSTPWAMLEFAKYNSHFHCSWEERNVDELAQGIFLPLQIREVPRRNPCRTPALPEISSNRLLTGHGTKSFPDLPHTRFVSRSTASSFARANKSHMEFAWTVNQLRREKDGHNIVYNPRSSKHVG